MQTVFVHRLDVFFLFVFVLPVFFYYPITLLICSSLQMTKAATSSKATSREDRTTCICVSVFCLVREEERGTRRGIAARLSRLWMRIRLPRITPVRWVVLTLDGRRWSAKSLVIYLFCTSHIPIIAQYFVQMYLKVETCSDY